MGYRGRDSNPRHADYDLAATFRLSSAWIVFTCKTGFSRPVVWSRCGLDPRLLLPLCCHPGGGLLRGLNEKKFRGLETGKEKYLRFSGGRSYVRSMNDETKERQSITVISDPPEVASRIAAELFEELSRLNTGSPEPYLDVGQAAEYMKCPKSRIYDLSSRGSGLRFVRDGKRILTRASWIDAYLSGEAL